MNRMMGSNKTEINYSTQYSRNLVHNSSRANSTANASTTNDSIMKVTGDVSTNTIESLNTMNKSLACRELCVTVHVYIT